MYAKVELIRTIRQAVSALAISGKTGKAVLQPTVASALSEAGFRVDLEDAAEVLPNWLPVWGSKDDGQVVPTVRRRRIDLVVYEADVPVALIETESDLNDLRIAGVTKRSGHYDVASIARHGDGGHFDSYNSLERMACAAFYWHQSRTCGRYPTREQAVALLEAIASDDPGDHNPAGLTLVLVSGNCRPQDEGIIARRLRSLSASLVCVSRGR